MPRWRCALAQGYGVLSIRLSRACRPAVIKMLKTRPMAAPFASIAAREIFGDTFIDNFVRARQFEYAAYASHVSTWERARYLEIV